MCRIRWKKLAQWMQNPYFLLGFSFLIWMLYFDAEDLITQCKLYNKLRRLERERDYYVAQITVIQKNITELSDNEDLLEKFAREKYFMKKKTEDLYVVADE